MKKIIHSILCLSLALGPFKAYSGDVMDGAMSQVRETQMGAKKRARSLVEYDLRIAMDGAFQKMAQLQSGGDKGMQVAILSELRTRSQKLEQDLNKVLQSSEVATASTQELVEAAIIEVERISRERFAISFLPAEIMEIRRATLQAVRNSIQGFQAVCSTGKSHVTFDFTALPLEGIPDPIYSYSFSVGFGGEQSNLRTEASGPHQSGSLKDAQQASQYLNGAAGLSVSFALSGGATTGVAGAVAVAAPYLAVAAIAVAVIMAAWDASEQNKFYQEIADAEMYKFNNTPRDVQVASYYREGCQQLSEKLQESLTVLDQLEDPAEADRLATLAMEKQPELEKHQLDSIELEKARSLLGLNALYNNKMCQNVKAVDATAAAPECLSSEDEVWYGKSPDAKIKIADLEGLASEAKKAVDTYRGTYTEEKLMELAKYRMALLFTNNLAEMTAELSQFQWQELSKKQVQALRKLNRILGLLRQSKMNSLGAGDALQKEIQATHRLFELQANYRTAVGKVVKVAFGRIPKADYLREVSKLKEAIHAFYKSYPASVEARRLNSMSIAFEQDIQTL